MRTGWSRGAGQAGNVLSELGDPRDLDVMVPVPAGEFLMGSTDADSDADDDEKPQHRVMVADFRMGRYPVTNAQYARFVAATGHGRPLIGATPSRRRNCAPIPSST